MLKDRPPTHSHAHMCAQNSSSSSLCKERRIELTVSLQQLVNVGYSTIGNSCLIVGQLADVLVVKEEFQKCRRSSIFSSTSRQVQLIDDLVLSQGKSNGSDTNPCKVIPCQGQARQCWMIVHGRR
mmetsp:Transcript_30955/g.45894  ORF Transcript_30955/g.45894 Transcript_30955/m.45894 type:complete len:125 (-) Transcript_30955:2395-2769(-)